MRVVLVSLAKRGGMVHFLAELAGGLAPLAKVAIMISSHGDLGYRPSQLQVVTVNTGRGRLDSLVRLLNPITWSKLSASIRVLCPDVVHIAGAHEWNPLVAILCRAHGVPLVYTVHDPKSHPGAPWTIRLADGLTRRLASRLVTLTALGKRQLVARAESPERVDVVPHPMYRQFRRWRPTEKPGKVILYFGRVEAYKGVKMLIEAFKSGQLSLVGWRLIIAGEGQLPEGKDLHGTPGIELLAGYVPDRDVARLFSQCGIVALPYESATQSGVIALAQAFNRPVVATAVGGLSEMVVQGRTGILVRPGDAAAFGRALRRLACDPARLTRMRSAVRSIARERWAPEVVARAHIAVYAAARARKLP